MPEAYKLLSEEESARIAEVSVDTIRQYMQCGLLDPVLRDNQRYFQEADIRTLFYTSNKSNNTQKQTAEKPVESNSDISSANESKPIEVKANLPAITDPELIQINKSLREQIRVMREERDWLRERIEKLESRSDREQMLLLSETENVRKLINQSEKRHTPWWRALPWFSEQSNAK